MFLSTPPSRVATQSYKGQCRLIFMFLSTPPSRVATVVLLFIGKPADSFYPRHPRGWRLKQGKHGVLVFKVSIHATLAGGDFAFKCKVFVFCKFLSTPPSRVATARPRVWPWPASVSIHATLAGGDRRLDLHADGKTVSIHATLAGGDGTAPGMAATTNSFYPRHPRGWRRWNHSPVRTSPKFLSTPPSRVATV